jgi:hypothetical protein
MGVGVAVNRGWHEGILRLRQFGNTQGSRDGIKHPNCRALRRWDRSRPLVDPPLKFLGSILEVSCKKGPFGFSAGPLSLTATPSTFILHSAGNALNRSRRRQSILAGVKAVGKSGFFEFASDCAPID